MKKLLFMSVMLFTLISYSQMLNKEKNGYTKVINTELSKKEIYQKLNEWIATNYKSAKDVIQLNTEEKIITKGNFSVTFNVSKYVFIYSINNSLTFSIREKKFKIDLIPNSMSYNGSEVGGIEAIRQYFEPFENIDTFTEYSLDAMYKGFLGMGYSEKKSKKNVKKYSSTIKDNYKDYLNNLPIWNEQIKLTFKSIEDYVNKKSSDDDW
ncbi:DUF4468 domain-containing protein [Polaribacter sp. SA4-10]|uniref:DUF4468 domain-containing protein n=1 Tax=Polaribacter sp. SA4-10 TaxID=754397 RepID=UPI000B3CCE2C|nr:DUF4468 domain-containing protein [Polaribacter sp. SA4-10]